MSLSRNAKDNLLVQRIYSGDEDVRDEIQNAKAIAQIIAPQQQQSFAAIVNQIDNGHLSWSKDAYTTAGITPATAGDGNHEAYNYFRQSRTLTKLVETAANALKASGHSLFAANENANGDIPRWDRVNGWIELGSVGATIYDCAMPLSQNFIDQGHEYYIQILATRRTSTALPSGIKFFCGFYDNTTGQEKFVEGSDFTLGYNIIGQPGAAQVQYKVIARTSSGNEIQSNILSVNNSPAVLSLNPPNYILLNFQGSPSFLAYDIYKKETASGNIYLIGFIRNSNDLSFIDSGQIERQVTAFPSVTGTRPKAYAETSRFAPGSPGVWVKHDLKIKIPDTYNRSLTTDKIWFRFGLTGATTDARQVLIDRIGVSPGQGIWALSANDRLAKSLPTITSASSSQGGTGTAGDPPPDGGGGPACLFKDVPVIVTNEEFLEQQIAIEKLTRDSLVATGNLLPSKITAKQYAHCTKLFDIETVNGIILEGCTETHPIARNFTDSGTNASDFKEGDEILTVVNRRAEISKIVSIKERVGNFEVITISLLPHHTYIAGRVKNGNAIGGIVCFNKPIFGYIVF